MPTSETRSLGPPAAARRRHTYQDMARYAAPPTASPRPSASSLVITTPAPSPLRARAALTVTVAPRSGGGPRRMQCASGPRDTVIAMTADRYALAREAAAAVAARTGVERHDAVVV